MRCGASIFEVRRGEIVALIGANGAGKTTTLAAISGLLRCQQGRIDFAHAGERLDISRMRAERIVAAGISHCPEGRQIFGNLSVSGEFDGRRLSARRSGRHRAGSDGRAPALSDPCSTRRAARQPALRRRTDDARHRSRSDEPPQAAVAGRAIARPGTAAGRADLRHPAARPQRGDGRPAGRAERGHGARSGRSRLCAGNRTRSSCSGTGRALAENVEDAAGLSWSGP